jgi:creatinine amidohydrolase/Fe(II)-dependent formamide hydrolase-like protein
VTYGRERRLSRQYDSSAFHVRCCGVCLTWMNVRAAIKDGKTTVIISAGGMEPNGPWLVTGKHNYVLRANCEAIARKVGNALCAPIIKLVRN